MNRSTAYTITESEDGQFSLIPQPLTETVTDSESEPNHEQETSMPEPASDSQTGQTPQSLLTLTDIETLSGLKYVTLQRLAQRHADQIPSEGAGRAKRYYPEAVEVFKRLKAETKPGRPAATGTPATPLVKVTGGALLRGNKPRPGAGTRRAGKMAPVYSTPVTSQATQEMDRAVAAFERAQLVTELETLRTIADPINRRIVDLETKLDLPGRP